MCSSVHCQLCEKGYSLDSKSLILNCGREPCSVPFFLGKAHCPSSHSHPSSCLWNRSNIIEPSSSFCFPAPGALVDHYSIVNSAVAMWSLHHFMEACSPGQDRLEQDSQLTCHCQMLLSAFWALPGVGTASHFTLNSLKMGFPLSCNGHILFFVPVTELLNMSSCYLRLALHLESPALTKG